MRLISGPYRRFRVRDIVAVFASSRQAHAVCHGNANAVHVEGRGGEVLEFLSPFHCSVYPRLLLACKNVKDLSQGKQVHAHIVESGVALDTCLGNHVVSMYGKC
eukprot:c35163_g1_i1 orf=97-408(+)